MNSTLDPSDITDTAGRAIDAVIDAAGDYAEPVLDTVGTSVSRRLGRSSSGTVWLSGLVALAIVGAAVAFARRKSSDKTDSDPKTSGPSEADPSANTGTGDVLGTQRRPPVNATV